MKMEGLGKSIIDGRTCPKAIKMGKGTSTLDDRRLG